MQKLTHVVLMFLLLTLNNYVLPSGKILVQSQLMAVDQQPWTIFLYPFCWLWTGVSDQILSFHLEKCFALLDQLDTNFATKIINENWYESIKIVVFRLCRCLLQEVLAVKKVFLKNFAKLTGKHLCPGLFLRNLFFIEHLWRLLFLLRLFTWFCVS